MDVKRVCVSVCMCCLNDKKEKMQVFCFLTNSLVPLILNHVCESLSFTDLVKY